MADAREITRMERLLALRACPTFGELAPAQLVRIAEQLRARTFALGSTLMPAGVPAKAIAFIVRGKAEIVGNAESTRYVEPPGVVGGVIELFAEAPAPRVIAHEHTVALELEHDDFEDLLEDEFDVFSGILRAVARPIASSMSESLGCEELRAEPPLNLPRELSLVERILVLRRALDFAGAEVEALAELAQHCREFDVEANTCLWHAGDSADDFAIVLSGRLRLESHMDHASLGPGSVAGAPESLAREPRPFAATAETALRAVRLPIGALLDVIEDSPRLGLNLLRALARASVNGRKRVGA